MIVLQYKKLSDGQIYVCKLYISLACTISFFFAFYRRRKPSPVWCVCVFCASFATGDAEKEVEGNSLTVNRFLFITYTHYTYIISIYYTIYEMHTQHWCVKEATTKLCGPYTPK